jgi:AraC family transcriptional regulator of adaptative response / DNA-3-methyladenine glycosylase II
VRRYPGQRVPGAWDPFELSVRAVLGQGLTVAAESALAGRLAKSFGERLSFSDTGALTVVFPAAEALTKLRLAGLPQARARAIRSLARAAASGLFQCPEPDEESLARLARVRGIGQWTAQYVAMRAFRQPDAFPAGDVVLRRAMGPDGPWTAAALAELSERWRPWRAYAAVYLWRAAADRPRLRPATVVTAQPAHAAHRTPSVGSAALARQQGIIPEPPRMRASR